MIIYQTTNLLNNKKYIGKDTKNNPKYLGSGALLLEDIKKYGRENFKKDILEYCFSLDELEIREIYYINLFNAKSSEEFYNLTSSPTGFCNKDLTPEKLEFISNRISKSKKGNSISFKNAVKRKEKLRAHS